jgi:inner membrane protein
VDTLTHALAGAAIAKAFNDKKLSPWGTIAGLTIGAFPDSDFILGLFNRQFYLEYHRAFTHSLLLAPVYALFFAWIFVKLSKRPHFRNFYRICLSVLISHVVLDLLTSYGTMILSPFFSHRYAWDLVFIVDLIFSGIIVLPLIAGLFWKKKAAWICRGALIGLSLYILFCWAEHQQAMSLATDFSKTVNEEVLVVASLPQPLSPFRWANYVETPKRVYQGFTDLLKEKEPEPASEGSFFERLNNLYDPPSHIRYQPWTRFSDSPWMEKALATRGVKFYYWFARFPVTKSVRSDDGTQRVEFMDVRFFLPGLRIPFVYYVEFNESGRVKREGFMER